MLDALVVALDLLNTVTGKRKTCHRRILLITDAESRIKDAVGFCDFKRARAAFAARGGTDRVAPHRAAARRTRAGGR